MGNDTALGMTLEDCKKLFSKGSIDESNNEIGDKVIAVEEAYNVCPTVCVITDPYDKLQCLSCQ